MGSACSAGSCWLRWVPCTLGEGTAPSPRSAPMAAGTREPHAIPRCSWFGSGSAPSPGIELPSASGFRGCPLPVLRRRVCPFAPAMTEGPRWPAWWASGG